MTYTSYKAAKKNAPSNVVIIAKKERGEEIEFDWCPLGQQIELDWIKVASQEDAEWFFEVN